jgi:hypothetical protein
MFGLRKPLKSKGEGVADKKYFCSANFVMKILPGKPAIISNNQVVAAGVPALTYKVKKMVGASQGVTAADVLRNLTAKIGESGVKRFGVTEKIIEDALTNAAANALDPIWEKNRFLELTKGRDVASASAEVDSMRSEIEKLREENKALRLKKEFGK